VASDEFEEREDSWDEAGAGVEDVVEMEIEGVGVVRVWGRRVEVVGVAFDGVADGLAPAVGAEGVDVFVLRDVNGLHESLGEVGDGASGSGFYVAADDGGDEACQGGAEIAGGEVVAGEEVGQVFAECLRGAGVGFFLGVVEAEVGIIAGARSAATAAIREREVHRDTRSVLFVAVERPTLRAAVERPTALREDIESP